jgi:hypothetical protein
MSEHRILRLKPALRLERRGQHGQNKRDKRDHRANLADSSLNKPGLDFRYTQVWSGHLPSCADFITTTPELKFSVHTRALCSTGISSPGRRLGSCGRRSRLLGRKTAERLTRNLTKDYRPHAAGSGRPTLTTVWLEFRFPPSSMALMLRPMFR